MAQAPKVQSIEQIISDLNPAFQGQMDVINQRRAQLPGQFQADRMALDAQKVQGFNQINNQATARGMSFSGVPLDEQATYLSTQYLPGMQRLVQQENEANLQLDEALASITRDRRLSAMDIRQNQQKSLESYLAEERQRAWEREQFQAEQAMQRAKMAQQASQAAAAQGPDLRPLVSEIGGVMESKKGRDQFVSPTTFRTQMQRWMQSGGDPGSFLQAFGGYVNPVHQENYGGYF